MWLELALSAFACFRLSEMLVIDDGLFDAFLKFREWVGVYDLGRDGKPITILGKLFDCVYCTGVWVAGIITLLVFPVTVNSILYWLAISGGQAFLQTIGGRTNGNT